MSSRSNVRVVSPMGKAVMSGDVSLVRALFEADFDVNSGSYHEETVKPPLHIAICEGFTEIVNYLLKSCNVDANCTSEDGLTAMFRAINSGCRDMVDCLARNGADLTGSLHMAVKLDKPLICMYLISRGVKVHASHSGRSPMAIALNAGNDVIVNILLDAGASIDGVFIRGNTALHCAVISDNVDLVKRICCMGVDLETRNNYGNTPLHMAVIYGLHNIVHYLVIMQNVRLDIPDVDNQTPFVIAVNMGYREIALLLLEAGYLPLRTDRLKMNPPLWQNGGRVADMMSCIKSIVTKVWSLQSLSIFQVRRSLGQHVSEKIELLPVPRSLQRHISLPYL